MVKLLVVDRNRVYAKRIKTTLERLAPGVTVDIAANPFEARSRIQHKGPYTLILADLYLAVDPSELQAVLDETETPKLIWSVVGTNGTSLKNTMRKLSLKPSNIEDLATVLDKEVLAAVIEA